MMKFKNSKYPYFNVYIKVLWVLLVLAPPGAVLAQDGQNIKNSNYPVLNSSTGADDSHLLKMLSRTTATLQPLSPDSLTANGSNPSPWNQDSLFTIEWTNPQDPLGILYVFYKFGSMPVRRTDFTGYTSAVPPKFDFYSANEGEIPLYVWLMDSLYGVDYTTAIPVWLRYDSTKPQIDSLVVLPVPDNCITETLCWLNSNTLDTLVFSTYFTELHPDSLLLKVPGLLDTAVTLDNGGINIRKDIVLNLAGVRDGLFTWYVTVQDSAGNIAMDSTRFGFDRTAPESTFARSPALSTSETFSVSWQPGTDGNGIGIAKYVLWFREDSSTWLPYDSTTAGNQAMPVTGTDGHTYDFEVIAVDSLGQRELRTGLAESTTRIDINFEDTIPPAAPQDLRANGANPSPWQNSDRFVITWQNPPDFSGIAIAYFKLDSLPGNPNDYSGTMPPIGNYEYRLASQSPRNMYVWLVDGAGNSGYLNVATVELRRDAISPVQASFTYLNPVSHYTDINGVDWYNQAVTADFNLRIKYQENYPDSAILTIDGIGFTEKKNNIPHDSVEFRVPIAGKSDGNYQVLAAITDFAGNRGERSQQLGLDSTAPTGALASTATDTSAYREFTVSWGGGNDGAGAGLAGLYTIKWRENNGQWHVWRDHEPAGSAVFTSARHKYLYEFEAGTFDLVDNAEVFTGIAETSVFVDTVRSDTIAPQSPQNLLGGGANPTPWQQNSIFILTWENPADQTGITGVYYKVGAVPQNNADFTEFIPGTMEEMSLDLHSQVSDNSAVIPVYLWLRDGNNNTDYRNNSDVLLRYDDQDPTIHNLVFENPVPGYFDGQRYWYNPANIAMFTARVNYSEAYADSVLLDQSGLGSTRVATGIPVGQNQSVNFTISIQDKTDGRYELRATVTDTAANRSHRNNLLGLDKTPPTGAIAFADNDTSTLTNFIVSWRSGNDGIGVGLSGRYTVRYRDGTGAWQTWQDNVAITSAEFTGSHGHWYEFEAGALDLVGNIEQFTGTFETRVYVDTIKADQTPPGSPVNLQANGANPGPWQEAAQAQLTWQNPVEQTWITGAFYKFQNSPANNNDYSYFVVGDHITQLTVNLTNEGYSLEAMVPVYLWLKDAAGNCDYRTAVPVKIRRDALAPRIINVNLPAPGYGDNWYDTVIQSGMNISVVYTEPFAETATLTAPGLWQPVTRTSIPIGTSQTVSFNQDLDSPPDGSYGISISIRDSSGHATAITDTIRLDGSHPVGVTARAPATVTQNIFTIQWTIGNDGQGVGIEKYEIWYRDNSSNWQLWRSFPFGTNSAQFTGQDGHAYEFAARAIDYLRHEEPLTGTAEARTIIDGSAPTAPVALTANGGNPAPWSSSPTFTISWQNPDDLSGITYSRFKLGSVPTSNQDTTGHGPGNPPFQVNVLNQGQVMLYIWLVDGVGNQNYRNYASVLLRYDASPPSLDSLQLRIPPPLYVNSRANWYRQNQTPLLLTRVFYSDALADSLILYRDGLGNPIIRTNIARGLNLYSDFEINIGTASDGIYPLEAKITDAAGNHDRKTVTIGLDKTPPTNTHATIGVDTAAFRKFIVSWPDASDGTGVGLTGLYNVRVKIDNGTWQVWKNNTTTTSGEYEGRHGHWYHFEAGTSDLLGNREVFLNQAEASVYIDTTRSDSVPPARPINLLAGGQSPSSWQSHPDYLLTWQFPGDQTGIAKVYYKFASAPANRDDYDGVDESGNNFLTVDIRNVVSNNEDSLFVYLWLEDHMGNVAPGNWSRVLLRYDALPPQVHNIDLPNPDYAPNWYRTQNQSRFGAALVYTETRMDSVILKIANVALRIRTTGLPSGPNSRTAFNWDFSTATDGAHEIHFRLVDQAGNVTEQVAQVFMDGTAPTASVVNSVVKTASLSFDLRWSSAVDPGAGIAGYEIWHRNPGSNWSIWKQFLGDTTVARFNAVDNRIYEFEVLAFDRVGNKEIRTGTAESRTLVDASPPTAPLELLANGSNPSFWQKDSTFFITWKNPADFSGIAAAYFKWDEAPADTDDWAGFARVVDSMSIEVMQEGRNSLYLWLADSLGNKNHQNHARIVLKMDNTPPAIDTLKFSNPLPVFVNNNIYWYNQKLVPACYLVITYAEAQADSFKLTADLTGQPLLETMLPASKNGTFHLNIPIQEKPAGIYTLNITLEDSAGLRASRRIKLGLDSNPPEGATTISPPFTANTTVIIQWGGGDDGIGSGLSGYYAMQYREKGKPWQLWYEKTRIKIDTLQGEFNKTYEFEAAAWDNTGNRELFTGTGESSTTIDPSFNDSIPPPAPMELSAGAGTGRRWQKEPDFMVTWKNPSDPSGIKRSWFKLDTPPAAPNDTSGRALARPPIWVRATRENGQHLYLWLEDNSKNVDFNNNSRTILRYDGTNPVIESLVLNQPHFFGVGKNWYNPNILSRLNAKMVYSELHADSIHIKVANQDSIQHFVNLQSGMNQVFTWPMSLDRLADGANSFAITIVDSAGNRSADSLVFWLDGTPPKNATASGPVTATKTTFKISWDGSGVGTDGNGSGLSGKYDVYVQVDGSNWKAWLIGYEGKWASYPGEQWHTYGFQVLAWDNTGNLEKMMDQPECVVLVDTTFIDHEPPFAPDNLTYITSSPLLWQPSPHFTLVWNQSVDPSGIKRSLFKLDSPPTSPYDTTGTGGVDTLCVSATNEDGQPVYVWLEDHRSNVSHLNNSAILLRYDATAPCIDSIFIRNNPIHLPWFNQVKTPELNVRTYFNENHPAQLVLGLDSLRKWTQVKGFGTGKDGRSEMIATINNLNDGGYKLTAILTDSAGNRSESLSINIVLDSDSPKIHLSDTIDAIADQSLTITTDIMETHQLLEATLFYRSGGQSEFQQLAVAKMSATKYQVVLDKDKVTPTGLEYFIRASDGPNVVDAPETGAAAPRVLTVKIVGADGAGLRKSTPQPDGSDHLAYRMISLPVLASDRRVDGVLLDDLGDYDKTRWRFFEFDPSADRYAEYPLTGDMIPGKAFWLITNMEGKYIDTGIAHSVTTESPFAIPLQKGWNDIGLPFNFPVAWDSILAYSDNAHGVIGPYTYDGDWQLPATVRTLQPWEGYAVYSSQNDVTLRVPALAATSVTKTANAKLDGKIIWQLAIEARCDAARDLNNFIGFAESASDSLDRLDYLEPHPIGSYVSLYFVHPEWQNLPPNFTTDFRSPGEDGAIWPFEVSSNIFDAPVQINLNGIDNLPENFVLALVDLRHRMRIDIIERSDYVYTPSQKHPTRAFELIIGTVAFVEARTADLRGIPKTYRLENAYPNPFNVSTTIEYQLPENSQVHLLIYNVLGQQVRELVHDRQEIGYYNIRWDGKNDQQLSVSSGVYLVLLRAGDFVGRKKMTLLK